MDEQKLNGVYKIVCKENGKIYIGESCKITDRWQEHIMNLYAGCHHSYKLQSDFDKYGLSNFTFEIIDLFQDNSIGHYKLTMHRIYREGCYIKFFNSIDNGYNIENTLS